MAMDWGWDAGIDHTAEDIARALNGGKAPSDSAMLTSQPEDVSGTSGRPDPSGNVNSPVANQPDPRTGPPPPPVGDGTLAPTPNTGDLRPLEHQTLVQTSAGNSGGGNATLGGDSHWRLADRQAYDAAMAAKDFNAAKTINDQAWINYDHDRAGRALQEAEARRRWKESLNAAAPGEVGGSSTWQFNHATQKFDVWNPKGGTDQKGAWESYTAEELAAHASPETRKAGPSWMWAQEQQKANQGYINNIVNQAADNFRSNAAGNSRYKFVPQYI